MAQKCDSTRSSRGRRRVWNFLNRLGEKDWDDWQCPECGWEFDFSDYDDPALFLGSRDFAQTGNPQLPFSATTWTEKWRCGRCGTIWEYENCNF